MLVQVQNNNKYKSIITIKTFQFLNSIKLHLSNISIISNSLQNIIFNPLNLILDFDSTKLRETKMIKCKLKFICISHINIMTNTIDLLSMSNYPKYLLLL